MGAFISRALGPPGLRPIARVRRVVGIVLMTTRALKFVSVIIFGEGSVTADAM